MSNSGQEDRNNDSTGDACADDDGDGLFGAADNCPVDSNPNQEDTDNDDIGDACDAPSEGLFVRGNFDIADAIFSLSWIFLGTTAPRCQDSADTNDDGRIDIADVITGLTYLLLGGAPPPPPFPNPGIDPTPTTP